MRIYKVNKSLEDRKRLKVRGMDRMSLEKKYLYEELNLIFQKRIEGEVIF